MMTRSVTGGGIGGAVLWNCGRVTFGDRRSPFGPWGEPVDNAPEVSEPFGDEDREALDEGRRALEAGDLVSDRELRAELGR